MSEARRKAALQNLRKANLTRKENIRKRALAKMDEDLDRLQDTVDNKLDEKTEKAIQQYFQKINRKQLKDEFLAIFYEMGGRRALKKWAKLHPSEYYKMMTALLRAETEKEAASKGGVTVNIFGAEDTSIDVTPNQVADGS